MLHSLLCAAFQKEYTELCRVTTPKAEDYNELARKTRILGVIKAYQKILADTLAK